MTEAMNIGRRPDLILLNGVKYYLNFMKQNLFSQTTSTQDNINSGKNSIKTKFFSNKAAMLVSD